MSFVTGLELSTRATRLLEEMGVETMEQFVAVRRTDFMKIRGAGTRTWREVEDMQSHLRGMVRGGRDKAKALAAALNDALREDPRLVAVVMNGRVRVAEMI